MFRNVLSAVVLAGVLAIAAADEVHATASAMEQAAPAAAALQSASTVTAPVSDPSHADAHVGFGWG
jgi:hypothetical protein